MRAFPIALLSLATIGVAASELDWEAASCTWWSRVQFLASDNMKGRFTGSPEFDAAAHYIVDQFQAAGLKPATPAGYLQPVPFTKLILDESKSTLALVRSGQTSELKLGSDLILGLTQDTRGPLEAPLVFVGYGLSASSAHYDDFRGLNLKGKIAVFLTGGPKSIPGNLRSYYASADVRWAALARAGAMGTIAIENPRSMDVPWPRQVENRFTPHLVLTDPKLDYTPGERFTARWNPTNADVLLAGSGHTFSEILAAAEGDRPLPHFEVPAKLRSNLVVQTSSVRSENMIGIWPGSDAQAKTEYVGLSAHLDHLGVGKPVDGDAIFNGAMDNASGVASLIEIECALGRAHPVTRRSIVFMVFTGEEQGMLGSHFLASRFPAPGRVVADVNMDMYLPLFPLKYLEVQGLSESTLGDDVREIAQSYGVQVQADKEPDRNRFIRSDQYSFIRQGAPGLAFKFGFLPGTPEDKLYHEWFRTRYHAVTDDTFQPVNPAAAAKFDALLLALATRVANEAKPPSWHRESFFRNLATH